MRLMHIPVEMNKETLDNYKQESKIKEKTFFKTVLNRKKMNSFELDMAMNDDDFSV